MILIADSGSTKTAWWLVDKGEKTAEFYTLGINPFYQSESDILTELKENLEPHINARLVDHIYFYGAGCHFEDKKQIVRSAVQSVFGNAVIEINNDLLGACRALLGHSEGIACIMGTGSNSCFYDGYEIKENVSPLGYILGDEGSGAVLGKLLVADVLKNQLPTELKDKFLSRFGITTADILDHVYKRPFPNRYLAKFAIFLNENIGNKTIYNLVYHSFEAFFTRNVMQYDYKNYPIAFTGSIAHYFKDVLSMVALDMNINISKIEQSPMEGLLRFHR